LAEEARELGAYALRRGDARQAFAAYSVAARVFDALGEPEKSFENSLNVLQIPFAVARSEDQYRLVYDETHQLLARDDVHSAGLGFRALTFAADCAYWAADASASAPMKLEWLGRAFDDLAGGVPALAATDEDGSVLRYASVLVVALQTLRDVAPDQQTIASAQTRFSVAAKTSLRDRDGRVRRVAAAALRTQRRTVSERVSPCDGCDRIRRRPG
jgi:hypothetical protein